MRTGRENNSNYNSKNQTKITRKQQYQKKKYLYPSDVSVARPVAVAVVKVMTAL